VILNPHRLILQNRPQALQANKNVSATPSSVFFRPLQNLNQVLLKGTSGNLIFSGAAFVGLIYEPSKEA
jgi:hypothetical protein